MAATWATCRVNRAGPAENGIVYIHLKDVNGTFNAWYAAFAGMKNQMLATALSAISLDKQVSVYLSDTPAYSTVNRIYVIS